MPKKIPFQVGDLVSYDGSNQAHITFVSAEYVTVCTHQWPKEGTLHGYQQTNVLVYPQHWNEIHPRNPTNEAT
jgi:hypothetical protein